MIRESEADKRVMCRLSGEPATNSPSAVSLPLAVLSFREVRMVIYYSFFVFNFTVGIMSVGEGW
jgi:hypothetical protein